LSDLHRISLSSDYRHQLVQMFPWLTAVQLLRFDDLVVTDRLLTDDLEIHPAFLAWLDAILGGRGGSDLAAALPPAPRPMTPGGALVSEILQ
jgi:hypothetical protein